MSSVEQFLFGDDEIIENEEYRRGLKRGGGSSSSSRSSSRSRTSTGNCYGDRCDDTGGTISIAIVVGAVIGGVCIMCLCYYLIVYCLNRKYKAEIKARKKRNLVHPDGDFSDG